MELSLMEDKRKRYSLNLFAEIELIIPDKKDFHPSEIEVVLKRSFVSAKNKKTVKKKQLEIKAVEKRRVYAEWIEKDLYQYLKHLRCY